MTTTRRTNGQEPRGPFNVLVSGSASGVLELNLLPDVTVSIEGEPVTDAIALVTAAVPLIPAINQRQLVTAALPWSIDRFVADTTAGTQGYVVSNPIPGVSAETKFFDAGSAQIDPIVGDTVEEYNVPTITGGILAHGAVVSLLRLRLGDAPSATFFFIDDANFDANLVITSALALRSIRGFVFRRSILRDLISFSRRGAFYGQLNAVVLSQEFPAGAQAVDGALVQVGRDTTIVDAGSVRAVSGNGILVTSQTEVRDAGTEPLFVAINGWIDFLPIAPDISLYGDNNGGPILKLETNNTRAMYADVTTFVVTSVLDNWVYPGAFGAWAALPSSNPANFVGIVPRL